MKQRGGRLAKGRLLGIQFDALFTDDLYLTISRHAIDMAYQIREIFVSAGYPLLFDSPPTSNIPSCPTTSWPRSAKTSAMSTGSVPIPLTPASASAPAGPPPRST